MKEVPTEELENFKTPESNVKYFPGVEETGANALNTFVFKE